MGKKKSGAKPKSPAGKAVPVEALKHKDTRSNIPTREQGAMVTADEAAPKETLYPRDPSLDPQLVWKGKGQQDANPLDVPSVPVYIQEKLQPQAIVEDLRESAEVGKAQQFDLFSDFNGLNGDPGKRTEFYRHDQHWTNRLILEDSLLVMTSLAEKERLKGRVQMIYVDPPYGIKFGSNWQLSTRKRDVKDSRVEDLTRQPEQIKAFRDTWELGIHSYLAYLRDRLTVARDLLTESGSIFVQIGDENVHLVRCVLDEVFGAENFAGQIVAQKTGGLGTSGLKSVADYLLWYGKSKERQKYRQLYRDKIVGLGEGSGGRYDQVESPDGKFRRPLTPEERLRPDLIPPGWRAFRLTSLKSGAFRENTTVAYAFAGETFHPGKNACWKTTVEGLNRLALAHRIEKTGKTIDYVRYIDDFPAFEISNVWADVGGATDKSYVVQTSAPVIARCILMTTDPGDLVLDPTCGSGTTAYVAEQWGRRPDLSFPQATSSGSPAPPASYDGAIVPIAGSGVRGRTLDMPARHPSC
jgi:adenine-specific DNA-methyltransferase